MPIPKVLVTRYFQLVLNRQFTEAQRELERIKQKMQKTDWNRGYFRALYGMYLSRKSSNDTALFAKIDLTDRATLNLYRREFLEHTKNGLHGDFDRGYFSAWSDCMRTLSKLAVQKETDTNSKNPEEEKPLETLRSDKSQATMANFFKGKKA
jgi:hypothetical protein